VRNLLLLIDGNLRKPFFSRDKENKIQGIDTKSSWHNEAKGIMMIDNYYKKMQSSKGESELLVQAQKGNLDFLEVDEEDEFDF
jgi:hypothetical protein